MPYHVLVTRQVLLDGPMTVFATLTLFLLVRFALSGGRRGCTRPARRWGSPSSPRRPRRPARGDLRVPRADAARSGCGCATSPCGGRAMVIAPFPITLGSPAVPRPARAISPGSSFGAPTTTGCSTRRRCRRRSARWWCRSRRRSLAASPGVLVAGDAAPVLDRGAGRLLRALARQGVPVPAPGRAGGRPARRPDAQPAAGSGGRRLPAAATPLVAQPARPHLGPHRGRHHRHLPGRLRRRPGGREAGQWIDANVPKGARS